MQLPWAEWATATDILMSADSTDTPQAHAQPFVGAMRLNHPLEPPCVHPLDELLLLRYDLSPHSRATRGCRPTTSRRSSLCRSMGTDREEVVVPPCGPSPSSRCTSHEPPTVSCGGPAQAGISRVLIAWSGCLNQQGYGVLLGVRKAEGQGQSSFYTGLRSVCCLVQVLGALTKLHT